MVTSYSDSISLFILRRNPFQNCTLLWLYYVFFNVEGNALSMNHDALNINLTTRKPTRIGPKDHYNN